MKFAMALAIHTAGIFLSAALLFSVQPLFARMVLPSLGGAPAVWNSCLFFFQGVLLAGYLYVHLTSQFLTPRRQLILHTVVILLPLLCLPIVLRQPLEDGDPVLRLLVILAVSLGAPVFAVCTTTPLLQKWFVDSGHPLSGDPYFLYSASNLGSMVALLSYPILLEPNVSLARQSHLWGWGYGVVVVLTVACGAIVWRQQTQPNPLAPVEASDPVRGGPLPSRRMWVLLSFVPASWLLAVTTKVTGDLVPNPMLWVVPLSIYLLTYILAFSRWAGVLHVWMLRAFPIAVLVLLFLKTDSLVQEMVKHLVVFFVGAMVVLFAAVRGSLIDAVVLAVPLLVLGFLARRRVLLFALGVGVVLLLQEFGDVLQDQKSVLHAERTFFGIHRVLLDRDTGYHELHHGRTMHGMQSFEDSLRREPLAYFHRAGPLGRVFQEFSGEHAKPRIASRGTGDRDDGLLSRARPALHVL